MAGSVETSSGHVAVLGFPFGGHTGPLLGLVFGLARKMPGTRFSFFTTSRANRQTFSERDGNIPGNIKPYDVADGIPGDYAFTGNPHEPANLFIMSAPENYRVAIESAVKETGKRVTGILADSFLPFAADMAEELQVPLVFLWVAMPHNLYVYLFLDEVCRISSGGSVNGSSVNVIHGVPSIRVEDLPEGVIEPGDLEGCLLLDILDGMNQTLPRAAATVLNFFQELDPTPLSSHLLSKFPSFRYLGFLTLSLPTPRKGLQEETGCLAWLDRQEPGSVAYIGFGTLAVLGHDELFALAKVLEQCKIPYLWSLKDNLKGDLPAGFIERTCGHGIVVPWVPQIQVLGHPSVGVFVTHCGSNSVYESIANGVPMICRPVFGEQRMVGRLVTEVWEVGVRVDSGLMTEDGLIRSFQVIFRDERGRKMREKAQALKELVKAAAGPEGKAAEDLKDVVEILSVSSV
ncbi:hypothetical protein SAY87_032359 [Trapa incisa]|uniref:Glycosyltransferase n=1 Tax=Trapa incisa TaxID=236973 RepID=A0AAN7JF84_9MYRT|nr:hypothetical protein SAY87_032359 [Trapa incisa]